jgi:hypothetical protein
LQSETDEGDEQVPQSGSLGLHAVGDSRCVVVGVG